VDTDKTIDAEGFIGFKGGIDQHVHLSQPLAGTFSSDDTRAEQRELRLLESFPQR